MKRNIISVLLAMSISLAGCGGINYLQMVDENVKVEENIPEQTEEVETATVTEAIEEVTDTAQKSETTEAAEQVEEASEEVTDDLTEDVTDELTEEASDELSEDTGNEAGEDEIRPEFKAAMDEYEKFYDEYCDYMKKYLSNDDPVAAMNMLGDYTKMLQQMEEVDKKFGEWNSADMTQAETMYYIDVTARIEKKLLTIAE